MMHLFSLPFFQLIICACGFNMVDKISPFLQAVDLYVLMSTSLLASCPQSGGQVLSVTVYPSEFGLKCMEVEAARGPHALIDGENGHGGDADDDDIDDEIANEKIRSYQLQRLK